MWYEDEDRFVRAPVPKTFDALVEQFQNDDSVLWESISLPEPKQEVNQHSSEHSRRSSTHSMSSNNEFCEIESVQSNPEQPNVGDLLARIAQLERENRDKDKKISHLQHEIRKIKKKQTLRKGESRAVDENYFKQQYEKTKMQYDKLKEALMADGKLKRVKVRAARAVRV